MILDAGTPLLKDVNIAVDDDDDDVGCQDHEMTGGKKTTAATAL